MTWTVGAMMFDMQSLWRPTDLIVVPNGCGGWFLRTDSE